MDPKTISLVQDSFQKVIPIADLAMEIFYTKLFEINPSVASLFPVDQEKMGKQRNKLRDMLVAAVKGLSNLDRLVPVLQNLGRRHVAYGVEDAHYADVGAALLATLETGLGEAFTPDVRQAWTDVYGVMAQTMTAAAHSQQA